MIVPDERAAALFVACQRDLAANLKRKADLNERSKPMKPTEQSPELAEKIKAARENEKRRMADIVMSPAAKGREKLAKHLAYQTGLSAKEAIAVLELTPMQQASNNQALFNTFEDTPAAQSAPIAWSQIAEILNAEMSRVEPHFKVQRTG